MAKMYVYKAKDRAGQNITGSILAENEMAVAAHIREKGCFVLQIKVEGNNDPLKGFLENIQRVKLKDIAILCRQFSTMVNAGVPLLSCLNILIEQTAHSPRLKRALQDVYKNVQEGETLSRSMAAHDKVFPAIMINMIEAGELGGVLDEVLERLAVQFEKDHKLNEKIKSALVYPAVVFSMTVLVVVFILTFVLPNFMQMFQNMHMELPLPTRILLSISDFLRYYWLLLLGGLAAVGIGIKAVLHQEEYRKKLDSLFLKLPVFGALSQKVLIARFSRTLSTLLRGGVSLISALEVVQKAVGNLNMSEALNRAQMDIREGVGVAHSLEESKLFTSMVIQMVTIGEESGTLDAMLDKVADFYEGDVDDTVSRLSSIMEPVIIGILGVIIGGIAISIVLPLFDVITHVG